MVYFDWISVEEYAAPPGANVTPRPVPAVQGFYCQDCGKRIEEREPVYNLCSKRICLVCWSKPARKEGA